MKLIQTLFLAACAASALALPLEESTSVQSSRDVVNILEGRAATTAVDCKGSKIPTCSSKPGFDAVLTVYSGCK